MLDESRTSAAPLRYLALKAPLMMPRKTLVVLAALASLHAAAGQGTIVESLSGNSWAIQDPIWKDVAFAQGLRFGT